MVGVARGSGGSGVIPVCARMAGRASGRGSENHTRPRIRHAGALSLTAVQDLERSMKRMKDLENVSPQKVAPKARKMIQAASKDLAAGLECVKLGARHFLGASGLAYAVEKKARDMQNSGGMQGTSSERCNLLDALNKSGVASPCVGAESGQHSGTMLVADRYLELRPIDVGGVKVPRPVNGHKYQNTEAVQVLYHAVHSDGGTLKHIVEEMQRLTWIKGSHQCWGKKVRQVRAVVDATPGLADVAAIIQAKFRDHVSKDGNFRSGTDDIMSISEFEQAVRDLPPKEGGCTLADCKNILLHAKQKKATLMAQDPASASVSDQTVRNYMQLLGGENGLLVRRKVSKRSHARSQAQESEMHMWAFLVTTLMNHALPADDGIGEKPPEDDWGIWKAVQQHHNMPIRPVPPAQIINCDASTIGHEYQRKQNEALKASKLADACRKQADTIQKTRLLLDKNTEAEDVLKAQAQSRINPQPNTASSGQANAYARTYANRKRIGMSDVTNADLRSAVSEKKLKAEGLRAFIVVRKYPDVSKGSGYREPTGPLLQSKSHAVPLTEQAVPFLQKPVSMQVTQAQPATPASNRVGSVPTMQISPPQSIFAQPSTAAAQLLADSSFCDGVKLSIRGGSIVVSSPPPACETISHWYVYIRGWGHTMTDH